MPNDKIKPSQPTQIPEATREVSRPTVVMHNSYPSAAPDRYSQQSRFLIVRASELESAIATLDPAIKHVYPKGIGFDVFPLNQTQASGTPLVALKSSDPHFRMGAGEELALENARIPNRSVDHRHLADPDTLKNIQAGIQASAHRMINDTQRQDGGRRFDQLPQRPAAAPDLLSKSPLEAPATSISHHSNAGPTRTTIDTPKGHDVLKSSGAKAFGLGMAIGSAVVAGATYAYRKLTSSTP